MPFNGWDAYIFLHISICAFKKQHFVFVLKVAHLKMTATDPPPSKNQSGYPYTGLH